MALKRFQSQENFLAPFPGPTPAERSGKSPHVLPTVDDFVNRDFCHDAAADDDDDNDEEDDDDDDEEQKPRLILVRPIEIILATLSVELSVAINSSAGSMSWMTTAT
uniref:Uncharacterized protein n=1 Tax=Vespula pensylvanica TaxID=30213 RepID=A0A834P4B9_VESPE|nr:hypothetical protein H0235_007282 [Vespula pensylvanica]